MQASVNAVSYVGLRDPQAFLEPNEGAYEPLRLMCIHVGMLSLGNMKIWNYWKSRAIMFEPDQDDLLAYIL